MASGRAVAVSIALLVLGMQRVLVLGHLECEKLPVEFCAFSVSSSGARCVLEKKYSFFRSPKYNCKSSDIMAEKRREWIESERCLQICGLQRMSVGMSTADINGYSDFSSKLCSDMCQTSCPNVADLYLTLAAHEGLYFPHLCEEHQKRSGRLMFQNENRNWNLFDNKNENAIFSTPSSAPSSSSMSRLAPTTMDGPTLSPTMTPSLEFIPTPTIIDDLIPATTMSSSLVFAPTPITIDAPNPAPTTSLSHIFEPMPTTIYTLSPAPTIHSSLVFPPTPTTIGVPSPTPSMTSSMIFEIGQPREEGALTPTPNMSSSLMFGLAPTKMEVPTPPPTMGQD